jgi:hypothetical protein
MERERRGRMEFVARAGISHEALVVTMRTLRALGSINLDDLIREPGFDSLGNGQCDTPEWAHWSQLSHLRDQAAWLAGGLTEAESDLSSEQHWSAVDE